MDQGRRFGLEPPWATECIIATLGIAMTSVLAIALFAVFPPNPGPVVSYAGVFAAVVALWLYCVALDPAEKGGIPCTPLKTTQDRERFCRVCFKSVPGLDHHCMWLNTCIGRRNYWAFFSMSLLGTAQHLLGTALAITTPISWPPSSEPVAGVAIFAVTVAALSVCATAAFGSLLVFHVHLVSVGLGTYDWLVHRADTRLAAERAANDAEAEARYQREQQQQQQRQQQQSSSEQCGAAGSVHVDFSGQPAGDASVATEPAPFQALSLQPSPVLGAAEVVVRAATPVPPAPLEAVPLPHAGHPSVQLETSASAAAPPSPLHEASAGSASDAKEGDSEDAGALPVPSEDRGVRRAEPAREEKAGDEGLSDGEGAVEGERFEEGKGEGGGS